MFRPRALLLVALLGLATTGVAPAQAHKRDFVYTYQWWTPAPGEKEIEPWMTYQPGPGKWEGQLEFEWPVTERWVVAPYLLFEQEAGSGFRTTGWKVEQRYRLGEFAEGKLLPALYAEVKKKDGEPHELEGKLLLSRYDGALSTAINLIAKQELAGREKLAFGYAGGVSWAAARRLQVGIEASGSLSKNQHFAGPTVGFDPGPTTRILVGAGLGLNHRSPGRVRMIAEYEWF